MNREVTLFVTSCGRHDLLKRTLASFVHYNTYPIKEVILCEDSGIDGCADYAKNILPYPTTIYYNLPRIGQMKTIEKYTKFVKTNYVFHLEDDYEFFDGGFIELSFKILDSDKNISQVLLEDEQHTFSKIDINNSLCYKVMSSHPWEVNSNNGDGPMSCYSWRPSLKRIEIQQVQMPYELWDDEYTIQLAINRMGYYSVVTKNVKNGVPGFCHHIGRQYHIPNKTAQIDIIERADFSDKIAIRLKDIVIPKYFSQCGEDAYMNINYFKNKKNGVYMELGALDGVLYSNTKFFEDHLGWKGILIEPHPIKFQNLASNRPNNYLFNNLVSSVTENLVFRFFIDNYSGVSGVEKTLPKEHLTGFFSQIPEPQARMSIAPKSLTEIVKTTGMEHIDFLSLDVEGHEYEVLTSWDFSVPIDIILIETLGGSQIERDQQCREILIKNGYRFDIKFKHNEIFILQNKYM
jgi:FkbM family methyltransferase